MADFEYRYLGDGPKIFTTRREDEKLVQPGDMVTSDVPMHHGHLEPLSEAAMKHAEDNELALERDGGELWQRSSVRKQKAKAAAAADTTSAPDAPKEA